MKTTNYILIIGFFVVLFGFSSAWAGDPCSVNADCNDGDLCTTDFCHEGACVFEEGVDCDDNNACTSDSCDPLSGGCVNAQQACLLGPCDVAVACNPQTGLCEPTPKEDGEPCGQDAVCQEGVCTPLVCDCDSVEAITEGFPFLGINIVLGTFRDDIICLFGGGMDLIFGFGGSDCIESGGGDDKVLGGSGNDVINGGAEFDIILGGPGADECINGESLASCEIP